MVLTISVVGNGSDQSTSTTAGSNGGPGAHAILTPNDLAQLMSGQTVTGMLNPDGTITLNSNVLSGHQHQVINSNDISSTTTIPKTETQSTPYPISLVSNQGNHSHESPPILQHGISICDSNNISRNPAINSAHCGLANVITTATTTVPITVTTADSNNMKFSNADDNTRSNSNNNNNIVQNNLNDDNLGKNGGTPHKKVVQKRLTAKQKQQKQQQQQQAQQAQQAQQQQHQQANMITYNGQEVGQFNNQQPQHQIVATVQLPNGQIGQLIAPSGGQFWSPNAINLQQLSMAVAAAMPIAQQAHGPMATQTTGTRSVSFANQNSNNNNNNNTTDNLVSSSASSTSTNSIIKSEHGQSRILHQESSGDMCQQTETSQSITQVLPGGAQLSPDQANWSSGALNLNQLSALAQQGVVQFTTASEPVTSQQGGQRIVEMISPDAIQNFLTHSGQPVQAFTLANGTQSFITQDPLDPNKWNLLQPAPQAYSSHNGSMMQSAQNTSSVNPQQQQSNANSQLSNNNNNNDNCNMMNGNHQNNNDNNNSIQFTSFNQGQADSSNKSYLVQSTNGIQEQQNLQIRSTNDDSISETALLDATSNSSQQRQIDLEITQSSQVQPMIKLKRLACTCPNCIDGENSRNPGDKKKQHICHFPDCNKVYGKTSHLRAHLRWHSGERPYVCNWSFCGKKFTRSDELQRHRRTHTGEKRFECTECLKRFMRSDHLSKHFKTHVTSSKKPIEPS